MVAYEIIRWKGIVDRCSYASMKVNQKKKRPPCVGVYKHRCRNSQFKQGEGSELIICNLALDEISSHYQKKYSYSDFLGTVTSFLPKN